MKPTYSLFVAASFVVSPSTLHAASQSWDGGPTGTPSPNSSGNWSLATNWSSDATPPTTGEIATLVDVTTGTRVITYDNGASGLLGTLTINQTTAGAINELLLLKSLAVTNAISLSATAGTSRITLGSTSSAGYTLTSTNGITVGANGSLVLTATSDGTFAAAVPGGASQINGGYKFGTVTAPVTVSGGAITVSGSTGTSVSSAENIITGSLNMTSGSLLIDNSTGVADRRLQITGDTNITGGTITSSLGSVNGTLSLNGSTNTLSPTTFNTNIGITLGAGTQSLNSTVNMGALSLRGSGIKTVTSTGTVGAILLIDGNNGTAGSATTLKLGSNITLTTGANQVAAANFGQSVEGSAAGFTLNRTDFGIDTNGFTLDLSTGGSAGVWTPNVGATGNVPTWTLSGTGRIRANAFIFNTAGVTTNVSAGTILEAIGGSTASNLSGTGTIDSTSTYRWSGGTTSAAVHTLTSTRTLGNLEVKTGILSLSSGATINAASTVFVGNSASTEQNTIFRFTGGGTYGNAFDLSKAPQITTSSVSTQPRNRIELTGASQTLNLTNNILLGQTGSAPNIPAAGTNTNNRRAEFNVVDATSTMNITGLISQNTGGTAGSFAGININGSNAGEGTVRLGNINNSFTAGVTVTRGTLILGGNAPSGGVGVLGNSTLPVSLADGGTTATSTVSVLTDGGFTVGRIFSLGNAAGGVSTASYVLGSTAAANSTFSGNIISVSSTDNKALTLTQAASGTSTFSGLISDNAGTGATNVIKAGLGAVILTGANSYDGTTTVNAGNLVIAGNHTGNGQIVVNNAGILQFGNGTSLNGSSVNSGTIFVNNTGTVAINKLTGGTITNQIASNPGATTTLQGLNASGTTNTFTATAFSNGGAFAINSTNSGAVLAFSGASPGAIDLKGTNLTVTGSGDTLFTSAGSGIYSSTTVSNVTKTGTGTLIYQANNGYTGTTAIDAGAVRVDIAQSNSGTYFVGNGGTTGTAASLLLGGGTTGLTGGVTFDRAVIVNPGAGGNRILGGTNTSGTNTLSANVNFAGPDNSGQDRSITLTAASGGTVDFTGGLTSGGIGVGQNVTKTGNGTVKLSSAGSYFGTTTVSAGTLLVNNIGGSGTGAGTVSVSSGATLGGSGTISGATTLTTATLAAGSAAATAGTLTFGAGLALNTGSIFEWDMQQVATTDPGAAPTAGGTNAGAYDKVLLNGLANSLTGSGDAIFKIVLGSGKSFSNAFWDTDKTWNDVFTGTGVATSLASIFSTFNANGTNLTAGLVTGQGGFTFNGSSTLTWTAVPEPSSAIAGLLLASGLLRRRRA